MAPPGTDLNPPPPENVRAAEAALERLGYRKVEERAAEPGSAPAFWVQEAEVPGRTYPVFLWDGATDRPAVAWATYRQSADRDGRPSRAIVVVPSERAAQAAVGREGHRQPRGGELAVLVLPKGGANPTDPHWHAVVVPPRELLDLATGIVVGLFRRAQSEEGSSEIDFQEVLRILRRTFRVDLHASLGVDSDEAALFLLYQLAQKYTFAPGDAASNLHMLVLKPTGPASRLPWFAA
jgi:hypothetical protein